MKKLWSAALMALTLISVAAPAAAQAAAGFAETAPMGVNREWHTATVLPNGEVLIAGGQGDASQAVASAELFDPQTESWRPTASMTTPRSSATATLLRDGTVLVAGGVSTNGPETATVELYLPDDEQWIDGPPLPAPRGNGTAIRLRNGKVLFAGGAEGTAARDSAWLYNPQTGFWEGTANTLSVPHRFPQSAMLPDGRVLVLGGTSTSAEGTAGADIYDPATNSFTPTADMGVSRKGFALATLPNGEILVAGGNGGNWSLPRESAELFDPESETWRPVEAPLIERTEGSAITLEGGEVLLYEWENTGELFDPTGESWSAAGESANAVIGGANVRLPDGRVLLTGGCECGPNPVNKAQIYTPATQTEETGLEFGDQPVGYRSPVLYATVENVGDEALWPIAISFLNHEEGDFAIYNETCVGKRIAPGGRCVVGVRFAPSATGDQAATLELEDNSTGNSTEIALGATGVTPPQGPQGDPGIQGPQGAPGSPGSPGSPGTPGLTGADGATGAQGAQGSNGSEGKAGAKGDRGEKGEAGAQGPQGPAGADAKVTCTSKAKGKAKTHVVTTCKVTFAKPLARSARVKLRANGRTVASGTLRKGQRRLTLPTLTPASAPYTVTVR